MNSRGWTSFVARVIGHTRRAASFSPVCGLGPGLRAAFFFAAALSNLFPGAGALAASPPEAQLLAGPSFRIHPSAVTQTETFLVRHPNDASVLFASANTINLSTGFVSEGVYVSTNAGFNWAGHDTCTGAPITFHRGDPGIAIDKNGRFILIRLGTIAGLYSHFSTNQGTSWSAQKTIATGDQDRGGLVSDTNPASANYGRTYALWVKFASPFPVNFAYSDDGASNWSVPVAVNSPPQRCQGGDVTMGPNGSVVATWAGVIGVSPFTEDYAGFARSTNGGANWTVLENAFDMNGIAGVLASKSNIRVNGLPRIAVDLSGGARNGWIYIVTTESNLSPAGTDADIILHRSTNSGVSWSAGIRVNQDAPNNGKLQYFPALHVDDFGGLNVLYYDDRTTTADSASVFLSRSTDGGFTWTDTEASDHHFRPSPIGGLGQGYQGDNIALNSLGNTLWPLWMDNFSGIYQAWTCPIAVTPPGTGVEALPLPAAFELRQNAPNPFTWRTIVPFELARGGAVRLEVFDASGRKLATPLDAILSAGPHDVRIDAAELPSGVYFYRLEAAGQSVIKKMVRVK